MEDLVLTFDEKDGILSFTLPLSVDCFLPIEVDLGQVGDQKLLALRTRLQNYQEYKNKFTNTEQMLSVEKLDKMENNLLALKNFALSVLHEIFLSDAVKLKAQVERPNGTVMTKELLASQLQGDFLFLFGALFHRAYESTTLNLKKKAFS